MLKPIQWMQKLLRGRSGEGDGVGRAGKAAGPVAARFVSRFTAREAAVAIFDANFEDMSKYAPEYTALLEAIESERILGKCRSPIYRAESKAGELDGLDATQRENMFEVQRERLVREIESVLVREVTAVRAAKPKALSMIKLG